ncbi:MAG TPA: hypothetical protein VEB86_00395 [Chryseosolibacter sp.]|nr:hypothetical protein [Chryseosolibacter sp.]
MKKITLFVSFVIFSLSSLAFERSEPRDIVLLWNELHNFQRPHEFRDLYASRVLFYGKWRDGQDCYLVKKKFLTPDFSQIIISDIQLRYFSGDIVKCDFEKQVKYKSKVKTHSCYLLLKRTGGKYYIMGESDLETDAKLGVSLAFLGDEKRGSIKVTTLLIIAVPGLLGFAYYFFVRKKPIKPAAIVKASRDYLVSYESSSQRSSTLSLDEEKGRQFENWVASNFDQTYFKVIEWRSDKYHNGIYAEASKYPDFEINMTTVSHNTNFAVECKWRRGFSKNRILWAEDYQIDNYREYEKLSGKPVFVVIGIGGVPSSPETLYVVPLRHITSRYLTYEFLQRYIKRRPLFFYDAEKKVLR